MVIQNLVVLEVEVVLQPEHFDGVVREPVHKSVSVNFVFVLVLCDLELLLLSAWVELLA